MNNRVNYTLVGFLVLFISMLILAFTYWLLQPSSQEKTKKYYIYFNESVLGLNLNAAVKYRGITVGKVTRLRISPKNTEQVEVLITILKSTPIKADTVAKLTSQGITGLSYINLSLGGNDTPCLRATEGEKYPTILTIPSFFENFEKSLGTVSTKISKTLTQTEKLLNDENQKSFARLLEKSAATMEKIDKLLNDETITSLQQSSKNLQSITYKVDAMIPNINHFINKSVEWEDTMAESFVQIKKTYSSMGVTMDGMKTSMSDASIDISKIMPTVNAAMLEMQELMIRLGHTLEEYEKSPSDILYKTQELQKAPGEK